MYISTLDLENFRCFRRTETTFVHPGADLERSPKALNNVTLLVGTNGSGKTSILRAVALGVLIPVLSESGYRPYYLLRRPKKGSAAIGSGWVSIKGVLDERETATLTNIGPPSEGSNALGMRVAVSRWRDYDKVEFSHMPGHVTRPGLQVMMPSGIMLVLPPFVFNRLTKNHRVPHVRRALDEYYSDFTPSFFLLGYGATRRVEEPRRGSLGPDKERGRRYLRAAGLFEEAITLFPLAGWLPQLRGTGRYKEIARLLNKTLPAGTRFTGRFLRDHQPVFTHNGVELPFPALSDGYRSYIGLLGDVLHHLHDCGVKAKPLTDLTGVVMVDDIDLHLHPKWQRVVVPRLAKAFPKLQFILTTHSPLVAGTVHAANVRVIGKNQVYKFEERLDGLSVDQILSSPYFGYTKPRSDASEKKLKELLEGPVDEGDPGPALEFLKALTGVDSTTP